MMEYTIQTESKLEFETLKHKVTELLKEEGFGVLTEIDVKETLKKKIDQDFKPYVILGACNPGFAYKSLQAENNIGVFLPCNVVIWDDGNIRKVSAMEPNLMPQIVENTELKQVAAEVSEKLHRVISKIDA